MDTATKAALIASAGTLIAAFLVFFSARRANQNVSDSDLRKWADSLLATVQQTQREMDQVRKEARALADELREVRHEAWREDSMPRFREWLSRRPDPELKG